MTDQEKIMEMIEQADDPRDRTFLLVLAQINASLVANTQTINEVADKLDKHLTTYEQHAAAEEARVNKGRGMLTVLAWLLAILQVVFGTMFFAGYHAVEELHDHIARDQVVDKEVVRKICKEELRK